MEEALQHQFAAIEGTHWWFQGRRRVVAAVIGPYLREAGRGQPRILDVGCGTGEMVDMLRAFGRVSALDASPAAVDYCRRRFGPEVTVTTGAVPDDLPGPGSTDVVTAFDVIEHLDDDAGALSRIHHLLTDRGLLILTVPALQLLWGPHDVLSHHRRRYRLRPLRHLIEGAGFDIERISYFNTWLFPAVASIRVLRRLARRGRPPGAASDFALPPATLNRLLQAVLASESSVLSRHSLPIGVSILAVARKGATVGGDAT